MTSSSESAGAVLGLFLLLQLVGFLALLLGGMYLLLCLQRAANGLDRLASVAEEWLHRQTMTPPVTQPYSPGVMPEVATGVPTTQSPSYPTSSYLPSTASTATSPVAVAPETSMPPTAPTPTPPGASSL